MLPGKVVLVVESVVGKELRIGVCADIACVVVEALSGEANKFLRSERNTHLLVAAQAEQAAGIARHPVVPAHPREAQSKFIDDRRREGVHEACACNFRRIGIMRREEHGDQRGGKVGPCSLGIEPIQFVLVPRRPIDLKVFLVVSDETRLRSHKVILDQTVGRSPVGCRIDLRMRGEERCHRIHHRYLVIRIGCEGVLRVVELDCPVWQARAQKS